MSIRRIKKELDEVKSASADSANQIFSVSPSTSDLFVWEGYIFGPSDSPYQGGIFKIHIQFPPDYPYKPPKVYFKTKILHPNINEAGMICLDILKNNWSPVLTISKVLFSISSLLTDPNPDDPLAPEVAAMYKRQKQLFLKTAREWTATYAQDL